MEKKKWTCDKCGKLIENEKDGWVEWLTLHNHKVINPRIVHRVKCIYKKEEYMQISAVPSDLPLVEFVGEDGLMRLLSLVSETTDNESREDFIRIIKRLHIPNYEESFRYFDEAIKEGVLELNTKPDYCHQYQMERVIEWKKDERHNRE